jgi:ketosteroid isomerase-like protein
MTYPPRAARSARALAIAPAIALAVPLALAACSQQDTVTDKATIDESTTPDAAAAEEVQQAALGAVAAYNAQDPAKAAGYDAPDYVGIFHGEPNTLGPEADAAGMKGQMAQAQVDWTLGEGQTTVSESGDIGIYQAPYTFTVTPKDGDPQTETGTWVAIFKRQPDGSMKLWRSIGSDSPAPAKPTGGSATGA